MTFLDLHVPGRPLLIPNPWDAGSARILEHLGFQALATTSSGFAATLGRLDQTVTRDEALAHAGTIVDSVGLPVSADLENGFADDADGVAETVRLAKGTGLAGCSVEDATADGVYDLARARERVAAAVEAAGDDFVITARAENYLHDRPDLADTVARLQAFQEVGAHVLYAPGLTTKEDIATVVRETDRPVNVLAFPGAPPVAELAELGVARVSVGGAFAYAAIAGLVDAATEWRDHGTTAFLQRTRQGRAMTGEAFG